MASLQVAVIGCSRNTCTAASPARCLQHCSTSTRALQPMVYALDAAVTAYAARPGVMALVHVQVQKIPHEM